MRTPPKMISSITLKTIPGIAVFTDSEKSGMSDVALAIISPVLFPEISFTGR